MNVAPPAASPVLLTKDQLDEAGAIAARAFFDDPMSRWLLPDAAGREKRLEAYLKKTLAYGVRYGAVYTTAGGPAGAAAWLSPGNGQFNFYRLVQSGLLWAPLSLGSEGLRRSTSMDNLSGGLRKRLAPGPHWYLMLLFVQPARQNQGIGSSLLRPVLAEADEARLPCYLETMTDKDVRFYEKRGFRAVWDGDLPSSGPHMWAMRREPQ